MFGGLMSALLGRNRKPAMAGPEMPMDSAPVAKQMPMGLDPAAMEPMQKTMPSGVGSMLGGMFGGPSRMGAPGMRMGGMIGAGMQTNVPGLRPGMQPSLRDTLMMRKPMQPEYENPVTPSAE